MVDVGQELSRMQRELDSRDRHSPQQLRDFLRLVSRDRVAAGCRPSCRTQRLRAHPAACACRLAAQAPAAALAGRCRWACFASRVALTPAPGRGAGA